MKIFGLANEEAGEANMLADAIYSQYEACTCVTGCFSTHACGAEGGYALMFERR